ncbi:MAG: SusC/RagA family TonB-linked outer membrane protein [Cyclobacteriaceae bacterium]
MRRNLQSLLIMLCLLTGLHDLWAQDRTISGKVTAAEDGSALPGVSVVLKGTAVGTQTDGTGSYTLTVPATGGSLIFSFIGLESREFVIGSQTSIDVALAVDAQQLNEVVVVAGGLTVQRREMGTQATTVKAEEITQGKASNLAAGLSGKVPGLLVSAVSSGVNPNYRVVLRGQRSLLGNNQALLVLDNIITPISVLGNLNPEDIQDIQVLNGAGAAALYGSDASNGALIITTKRGKAGKTEVKFSNTTTIEQVSYLPKLQKEFGSGTTPDQPPVYTPYENQQFGPRFDGTIRAIGKPLQDNSQQFVKYSPTDARTEFWETGIQNQYDFSVSGGDDKSTIFASAQYFNQKSTVPWDKYKRYSFKANLDRKLNDYLKIGVSANYIANIFDISLATGQAYNNVLMSPAQVDITKYSDWRHDKFANPNGYYNEYYPNPWFTLSNNRNNTKNNYLQGVLELKWNPIRALTFTGRLGLSARNIFSKFRTGKFVFSDYTKSISGGSKLDVQGFAADLGAYENQLVGDFFGEYRTNLSDNFTLNAVVGVQTRENTTKNVNIQANGLVVGGLYNVGNTLTNLIGGEFNSKTSQIGIYSDVRFGFKEYLFLHMTARNDWRSVLAKDNRSFLYGGADMSFIASDAISALKNSDWIDAIKIRGGYSQVGQVNIDPYALTTTYDQRYGYPYSTGGGFSLGNQLVSPSLKPELTSTLEGGFDIDLKKYSASIGLTVYQSRTKDQTLPISVSSATGFNAYLTNVGEVENKGLETYIRATPIETSFGLSVTVGANYSYNRNKVLSLSDQSDLLVLPNPGVNPASARIVAKVGSPFPMLQVSKYNRTPDGKVIVDANTGFPATDGSFHDVGITTAPHIVGVNAEIKFKGVRVAAVAEYRTGHFIYNAVTVPFDFSGAGIRTTWYNRERFVFPNSAYQDPENPGQYVDNTNVTTATGGADFWSDGSRNTGIGENYTHSAGFWKIREISIRYDFPSSLLSQTKFIKSASIGIQGRNLFIWVPKANLYTDPEYSANGNNSNAIGFTSINQTPPARYVGGTISLTF